MLLDDAVDTGKAQAGSLADVLGGEKGFEQMRHQLGGNSAALILNRDTGKGSGPGLTSGSLIVRVNLGLTAVNR